MLESAHEHDPNALWWIKGDGVDIVKVSTCGKWSGDADVCIGVLSSLRSAYDKQMSIVK